MFTIKKICFFLFILLQIQLSASGNQALTFVVEPYLQFSTQNSIHILWETNEPSTAMVEYGPALTGAQQANLSLKKETEGLRSLHVVKLENLEAGTTYFWRVTSKTKSGLVVTSSVSTFKTAVGPESAVTFALISDTQRNNDTPWGWGKIAEKVWSERPDFVVHAGDLVDKGLRKEDWTEHFFPFGTELMKRVVVFSVLGNHEQDAPNYYEYTVAPAPEYYYTFNYGNIQFFMLDSNRDVDEDSEQYTWLEWELAKSTAQWKIVIHHHPPYTSDSNDYGDTAFAKSVLGSKTRVLTKLYDKYGVDFCFYGHTHLYERTWPIKNQKIDTEDGVIYINAGGAGGYIEDFAPTRSWFTKELQAVHHFCTFSIYQDQLECKAIDFEGKLIDVFAMKKLRKPMANNAPPRVKSLYSSPIFTDTMSVILKSAFDQHTIVYTTDGSEPNASSKVYQNPILLSATTVLKTRAIATDGQPGDISVTSFRKMAPQKSQKIKNPKNGLKYQYFEGSWDELPSFSKLTPVSSGVTSSATLEKTKNRDKNFAMVWEGYVEVKNTGRQKFYINSDDGSKLYINDELIINHDGHHSAITKTGETILEKGLHKVRIEYFQGSGSYFLETGWINEKGKEVKWTEKEFFISE